jgi:hypothetical protein
LNANLPGITPSVCAAAPHRENRRSPSRPARPARSLAAGHTLLFAKHRDAKTAASRNQPNDTVGSSNQRSNAKTGLLAALFSYLGISILCFVLVVTLVFKLEFHPYP